MSHEWVMNESTIVYMFIWFIWFISSTKVQCPPSKQHFGYLWFDLAEFPGLFEPNASLRWPSTYQVHRVQFQHVSTVEIHWNPLDASNVCHRNISPKPSQTLLKTLLNFRRFCALPVQHGSRRRVSPSLSWLPTATGVQLFHQHIYTLSSWRRDAKYA